MDINKCNGWQVNNTKMAMAICHCLSFFLATTKSFCYAVSRTEEGLDARVARVANT